MSENFTTEEIIDLTEEWLIQSRLNADMNLEKHSPWILKGCTASRKLDTAISNKKAINLKDLLDTSSLRRLKKMQFCLS